MTRNTLRRYGKIAPVLGVLLVLWANAPARAQQLIEGPVTSLLDSKSLLANPALLPFHRSALAVGVNVYHLDLGDEGGLFNQGFRQGFLTLSTPHLFNQYVGVGVTVQYFDSPIFRRGLFGVQLATRILPFLAIGGNLAGYSISYNESNFDLVDPGDPVFERGTGKMVVTASVGFFAQPSPYLSVAAGARNVNEPNVSLIDDAVVAHRELFGGLSLTTGPVRSTFEVIEQQGTLEGRAFLEFFTTGGTFLRGGGRFDTDQMDFYAGQVEVQLRIAGGISVNYSFDLPISNLRGNSFGSHQLTIILGLGSPSLRPPVLLPKRSLDVQDLEADLERVYLTADLESIRVYEERVVRRIPQKDRDRLLSGDAEIGIPSYVEPVDSLSNDTVAVYRRTKEAIDSTATVDWATLPIEERLVTLDPPSMTFYLHPAHFDGEVPRWEMIVKNRASRHTKTFSGTGALPSSLEWNWQYDNGDLIEPGLHRYYVAWTDGAGHRHTSNMSLLAVSKHLRTITITTTPNGEKLLGGAK